MKMLRAAVLSALVLAPLSNAAEPAKASPPAPAAPVAVPAPTEKPASSEPIVRGEPLAGAPKVTFAELMKAPEKHDGKTIQLEAHVRKACSKKGCWMELANGEGPGVRVKFKDYGFFVPLDADGSTAVVEGVVKVAELSEGTAKHFEKEGATIHRDASGKATEVQMVATGVVLRR